MALTVTPGYRVTPPPVSLADGPVAGARERHPLLASAMRLRCDDPGPGASPERDHGVEGGPAPLQPAIGQDAGGAAVDLWKTQQSLTSSTPGLCITQSLFPCHS